MSKFIKALKGANKREEGITGLETAIILIAFVIVASVFAFVVLSTGLFSAERGKETVFAGLEKAQGNLEARGALTVSSALGVPTNIKFNLGLAAGGSPVNLDPAAANNAVVMNLIDTGAREADLTYTITWIARDDTDNLLERGDLAEITIALPIGTTNLTANERFTVEVVPPLGGTMLLARTMPPSIDAVMDLH